MPDRGTEHVSSPLSNVAVGVASETFIWDRILKPVPVQKDNDTYYKFLGEEELRYHGKIRADDTQSPKINTYSASTDTYSCKEHSYHDVLTDKKRNRADPIIRPEIRMTRNLTTIVNLDIEVDVSSTVFGAGNYGANYKETLSAGEKWDASNPEADPTVKVDEWMTKVQKATGMRPNKMIVGLEVHDQLKRHPVLLDIYKHTQKGILTKDLIKEAMNVKEYIVGEKVYISTKLGQSAANTTRTFLWGKFCALLVIPKAAAIDEPSWGYTFLHTLFGTLTAMVSKWKSPELGKGGITVEVSRSYDVKVTGQNAGALLSAVIA